MTMTTRQVAEYLGYSIQTIYNLRSMGRLPYHRLNGKGRPVFIKSEIDELLSVDDEAEAILNRNALDRRCPYRRS